MIFFFTGTGNSLYAAKQLEDDPISIPQALGGPRRDFTADSIGIVPDYINILQMVDNWLPAFDMDEQRLLDKHVEENLHRIREDIRARKNAISPVAEADREAHRSFLRRLGGAPKATRPHLLRVTEHCTGCGICQKVCPTATVQVRGGRAEYTGDNCQTCLACAHACPQKAIQLTVPEKNPQARYRNEHISLQEIIAANCQNR